MVAVRPRPTGGGGPATETVYVDTVTSIDSGDVVGASNNTTGAATALGDADNGTYLEGEGFEGVVLTCGFASLQFHGGRNVTAFELVATVSDSTSDGIFGDSDFANITASDLFQGVVVDSSSPVVRISGPYEGGPWTAAEVDDLVATNAYLISNSGGTVRLYRLGLRATYA